MAWVTIGINKPAADTRPGPAHARFFGGNSLQELERNLTFQSPIRNPRLIDYFF